MIFPAKNNIFTALICSFVVLSGNAHAQQVALLDSGADPDQGFNLAPGFNYFLNTDDTSDVSTREGEGHGTVSTRLVAESFDGQIVPFVVTDGTRLRQFEPESMIARDSALSDILGRDEVRVIGITWGTEGITGSAAPLLPELSNANKVIAIMAGNEFSSQPNALATTSFNLAGVIIVGATDADGVLFPEANRAGTTAAKYVAAIGLPELTATVGGASWATARIAGIAGAVLQQNPNLTAAEVVQVILESAEDRGDEGIDAEYGRGFIANAQQVLNNVIGPVTIPTQPIDNGSTLGSSGGGGGGGGGAGLLVGGALIGALVLMRKPKEKLEKTLVLDSYGRTFQIDLGEQTVVDDDILHLTDFFHALDQTSVSDGFYVPELNTEVAFAATTNEDHRFDMIEYFAAPDDVVINEQQANMSVALGSKLTQSVDFTAGYQVSPGAAFGRAADLQSHKTFGVSSFISGQSFDSLLSGFSSRANTMNLAYKPGSSDKATLNLGLVSIDEKRRFGQQSFSSILEAKFKFNERIGSSLQYGQIQERGSVFGGAAGGVFGVKTATTHAVNIGAFVTATDKLTLVANYGLGRTSVDSSVDSLLSGFSGLRSDWYSLGMIGNNIFRAQDQLGVSLSQPLKIRSGEVNFSIPTARDLNGDIAFDTERLDLAETNATEHRAEAYYRTMLTDKLEFGSFVLYRQNPNHVRDYGNETLFMATLRYRQ
ncbi:MAG: S8/S53 family peptidase [Arenicella sp.]|nr:S8/S53 family peptidase [Arenicella sp.]